MRYWFLSLCLVTQLAAAATAFYVGERIAGLNRICYYDHLGSEYVITIKVTEICPITIQVPDPY